MSAYLHTADEGTEGRIRIDVQLGRHDRAALVDPVLFEQSAIQSFLWKALGPQDAVCISCENWSCPECVVARRIARIQGYIVTQKA